MKMRKLLFVIAALLTSCNINKNNIIYLSSLDKTIRTEETVTNHQILVSGDDDNSAKQLSISSFGQEEKCFFPNYLFKKFPNVEKISIGAYNTIILELYFEQMLSELSKFENLKELLIQNKELKYIPCSIIKMKNLEYLDFRGNHLKGACNNLGSLKNLKKIYLSNNFLGDLDKDELEGLFVFLSKIENLESLSLTSNNLEYLPSSLSKFKNLKSLHLDKNQLNCIPEVITEMECLTYLSIDFDEKFMEFPDYLDKVDNLQVYFPNIWDLTLSDYKKLKSRYPNIRWNPIPNK